MRILALALAASVTSNFLTAPTASASEYFLGEIVTKVIRCESIGYQTRDCHDPTIIIKEMKVRTKHSMAPCSDERYAKIAGEHTIRVYGGCRADFDITGYTAKSLSLKETYIRDNWLNKKLLDASEKHAALRKQLEAQNAQLRELRDELLKKIDAIPLQLASDKAVIAVISEMLSIKREPN